LLLFVQVVLALFKELPFNAMPLPSGYLEELEKWWSDRLLYTTIFEWVLEIIRIKIRHFKGKNKSESSIRLDIDGPDIGVH